MIYAEDGFSKRTQVRGRAVSSVGFHIFSQTDRPPEIALFHTKGIYSLRDMYL